MGKKILLISTDPASNLQDVFDQSLNGHGTAISEVPGLTVVNLDPEQAAAEYRESVIAPFRENYLKVLFRIWKNSFQVPARWKSLLLMSSQILLPMLLKQRSMTILF